MTTPCAVCAYATERGQLPDELLSSQTSHCDGCHREWTSKAEAHCTVCHLHFTSNASADLHDPYCTPVEGVTRKRILSARRSSGFPLVAIRQRKHGEVFASWSPPADGDGPLGDR